MDDLYVHKFESRHGDFSTKSAKKILTSGLYLYSPVQIVCIASIDGRANFFPGYNGKDMCGKVKLAARGGRSCGSSSNVNSINSCPCVDNSHRIAVILLHTPSIDGAIE